MKNIIVFDIETKKEFAEVGGRDFVDKLGISVLAAHTSDDDKYHVFEEHELQKFEDMIRSTDLLVGFNITGFDIPVLQPYTSINLQEVPMLDMMDDVVRGVGFRVSLDNLARTTLSISKSADGLQALQWFREGRIQEVKDYCVQDVKVTKELYEYGKKQGHIKFVPRDALGEVSIPVRWGEEFQGNVFQVLKDAFDSRRSVEIDYVTKNPEHGGGSLNTRLVDVYTLNTATIEGYCHLRKGNRIFKLDRILRARRTDKEYQLHSDVQSSLL
ncbi:MAG: ribonuclease H-like domain-containing protein [bacterium]|nr:ribonuclease H-like domain-containing protein [bacterium]